jgi:integrase
MQPRVDVFHRCGAPDVSAGTENTEGLSPDTVRKRISNSKQFFQDAVDHRRISENPFHRMKSSVKGNRTRDFFVTLEMAQRVLETCPDAQWRLLFALSRFGGLRCPSEHLALRLDAVDWSTDRIRIVSPKTEHLDGKASREIPIFPELRPYLEEVWNQAEPGATHFVTRYRNPTQNLRTQLRKIIKRAVAQAVEKVAGHATNGVGGAVFLSRRVPMDWKQPASGGKTLPPDHTRTRRRCGQWCAHHFCSQ